MNDDGKVLLFALLLHEKSIEKMKTKGDYKIEYVFFMYTPIFAGAVILNCRYKYDPTVSSLMHMAYD